MSRMFRSLDETENGSILLMHDRPTTAKALDRVLTALESEGYRFVLPAENSPSEMPPADQRR